jgi:1,4-dihydroxy-2-naphthoate polyprenyltransferase
MNNAAMSPATAMSGPRAWILAVRLPTLPAAVVPVLVGTALAIGHHQFRPLVFITILAASLLIQIGTNFANDYFDFRKGADTAERLGPVRISSGGLASPNTVLRAALGAFGVASIIGLYLVFVGGWPILVIGLAAIVAGIAYTGGPAPFGYHGLGDVVCFAFFGVVAVAGTYYLQTGAFSQPAFLASLPVACLVTAILVVNNIRDIDTDRAAGKMTLAVRLGRRGTRREYLALIVAAYAVPFAMAATGVTPWWLFWLPLATLPLAVSLVKVVANRVDGRSLNVALKGTGRLHLLFGALFALSLLK